MTCSVKPEELKSSKEKEGMFTEEEEEEVSSAMSQTASGKRRRCFGKIQSEAHM